MLDLPKKLQGKLSKRKDENALRSLPVSSNLIDFFSNDYLGLSKNNRVFTNAKIILEESNSIANGASGSRLLSGNHKLYSDLENFLADSYNAESALVFNSGYDANLGFFSSVLQRGDVVFYDEFIHASIREGLKLGHAKAYKFKHNDLADLGRQYEKIQQKNPNSEIYIVTESVFSMDGDSPDLKAFANFSSQNSCRLVIDEAHATGCLGTNGNGLVQELGLEQKVFARILTFGKALGCHGAAILGKKGLIVYLINFARSFIYSTGLPPHSIATILAAYNFLLTSDGAANRGKLELVINQFNKAILSNKLDRFFVPSKSAIHCCIVPGNEKVRAISNELQKSGFDVRPILSPTVAQGKERLRFCLHSYNTEQELDDILKLLGTFMNSFEA